jgi:hypothetical protein
MATTTSATAEHEHGHPNIVLATLALASVMSVVKLPAKEYELLRMLAREPTRVLTKVNFEPRPEEGEGFRDLGAGLAIRFPLGRLWAA